MMAKCDKCGYIHRSLDPLAKPVYGFVLETGKVINICHNCVIQLGELTEEAKNDPEAREELRHFFDGIGGEKDD